MAKKRRRKKARRSSPKKRRALKRRKHRRATSANPRRRRRAFRRKGSRKKARNPGRRRHRVRGHFAKRRGKKRSRVRAHMSNPRRRRAFAGRRRRRNPGGFFGDLALAVLAGIGGFVGTFVLGYFVTPAAQMVEKGQLYRGGVGLAGAAGGAFLAKKHPLAGAALAVGSLLGAFGGFLTLQVLKILPQKSAGTQQQPTTKGLGAVFTNPQMGAVFSNNEMGAYQQMGAVGAYKQLGAYQQQMGAVFSNNSMGEIGDSSEGSYTPAAPWMTRSPFDAPAGY